MNETAKAKVSRRFALAGQAALGLMLCTSLCVPFARGATDSNAATGPQHATRHGGVAALEDRVMAFSKALGLDAAQQTQFRRILLEQREAVRRIWSDKALLPAERAPAMRVANERTGDEIRAILNDEQKKKYNPPKPSTPREQGDTRSVEQWLDATRPR
jgi:hypothetical protein